MNSLSIKVADLVISIHAEYVPMNSMYKNFRCQQHADLHIKLDEEDLSFNYVNSLNKAYVKTSSILKKISDALIEHNVLLFHGAVIAYDNIAILFTASSGTGKTTHIRKWLEHCKDSFVINGDKPFLKFTDDGNVLACGSPWAGKENMYTNTMIPLRAIVQMTRADENLIEQVSFAQAFPFLLQQVYRPDDEEKMRKTLRLMQRLGPAVTFWKFQCNNFKEDCFRVAYEALVGQRL